MTFAAAVAKLQRAGIAQEGFLPVPLVSMKVPALLLAIVLHRAGELAKSGASDREIVHEALLIRSVVRLFAGLLVGFAPRLSVLRCPTCVASAPSSQSWRFSSLRWACWRRCVCLT